MRVTSFMIYNQLLQSLQQSNETYSDLQLQLSTGKKINKTSDDVAGSARTLDYQLDITQNDQFSRNAGAGSTRLDLTSTVLSSVGSTVDSIKSLLAMTTGGTQDPTMQASYAQQASQYRDQLTDLADTKYLNQYLFSGFRTDLEPYGGVWYSYQGDNGVMNTIIGQKEAIPVNVTGSEAFSYTLAAPVVTQIDGGKYVHYTPGAGTTTTVQIRDTDDTTVLQTFSFSNVMQMTDIVRDALSTNDSLRLEAMKDPFNRMADQVLSTQADVGARQSRLNTQTTSLTNDSNTLKDAVSEVQNADPNQTAIELNKMSTVIQSLQQSASLILSKSLFNFLQ